MGKHGAEYARVERDHYPTPYWVIAALAEWLALDGLTVWECACGDGGMVEALRQQGCARVYGSDINDYGNGQDETFDFVSGQSPKLARFDLICTNPPYGPGGRQATAFVEAGLKRLGPNGILALLLPADFDSAKKRRPYFADCPDFIAKIMLNERIVWFTRNDGVREAPRENHAFFIWQRSPLRVRRAPVVLYAPTNNAHEYNGRRDFSESINDCYRAVRERVAAGGPGWSPNNGRTADV